MPLKKRLDVEKLVEEYIQVVLTMKVWHIYAYVPINLMLDSIMVVIKSIHVLSPRRYHQMLKLMRSFTNLHTIRLI